MKTVTIIFSIFFVIIFISGIVIFPDAPIYQKGEVFVGKYGSIHTQEHFADYRLWSILTIISFLVTFILNIILMIFEKKDDEKNNQVNN